MILTCPECATRYFVPDETLGGAGRTVRCTSCKASWHAMPETALELVVDEEQGAIAQPTYDLDVEPAPTPADLPGEELPKLFRDRVKTRQRMRKAAAAGAVWGLLAAGVLAALAAAALFRGDVVAAWPKTASAYAAVGLPVNATGLVIEREQADLDFAEGRPALVVRGAIRNVRGSTVRAPALKVTLLNKQGRAVRTKIAHPAEPEIPAGAARYFAVDMPDPPGTVTDVEIRFVSDRKGRKEGPPAARPVLRTASAEPSPVEHEPALKGQAH